MGFELAIAAELPQTYPLNRTVPAIGHKVVKVYLLDEAHSDRDTKQISSRFPALYSELDFWSFRKLQGLY